MRTKNLLKTKRYFLLTFCCHIGLVVVTVFMCRVSRYGLIINTNRLMKKLSSVLYVVQNSPVIR